MEGNEMRNLTKLELKKENEKLRKDIVGWLNWIYYLPNSWRPVPMIKKSRQLLRDSAQKRGIKIKEE